VGTGRGNFSKKQRVGERKGGGEGGGERREVWGRSSPKNSKKRKESEKHSVPLGRKNWQKEKYHSIGVFTHLP